MKTLPWILLGILGAGILILLAIGATMFEIYKNRWGNKVIVRKDLLGLFVRMREILRSNHDIDIEITGGWRGREAQEKAFAAGNSAAHFGLSPHNFGVAFDVVPVNAQGKADWNASESTWDAIGSAGRAVGLRWGNDWNDNGLRGDMDPEEKSLIHDPPHFEIHDFRALKAAGKIALYESAPEGLA